MNIVQIPESRAILSTTTCNCIIFVYDMRRMFTLSRNGTILIILFFLLGACKSRRHTVRVIKPRKHIVAYSPKWHKKAPRTRVARMKN